FARQDFSKKTRRTRTITGHDQDSLLCFIDNARHLEEPQASSSKKRQFMTIQQAERFIKDYLKLLTDDSKRGSRRDPSLLPVPKDEIIKAIKLELAQLFLLNSHTNEELTKPLINGAMFIDSFSDLPFEASDFIESMHRRRREIDSFYVEL